MYQRSGQEMPVPNWSWENGMEDRVAFSYNKTFWSQKVGQIKKEEREHNVSSPSPACQGAWDDSERLQLTQIQWWNWDSNNHSRDQDIKVQERQCDRTNFKGGQGKTCSKCSMSHPLRECQARGKKCHKCGNKNHFSTCCRSKQKGPQDSKRPPRGRSTMRCPKGRARWSKSRARSRCNTQSAHSIELNSFQDHP